MRREEGAPAATPSGRAAHARLCRLICVHVRDHRGAGADAIVSERETHPWGGYAFFGGDLGAVRELAARLREAAGRPLLLASDLERGLGQQLAGGTSFPPPMALGASGDATLAAQVGEATGREARALGLNCVFAPVLDLANEPANPIVCTRAFGDDPDLVSRLGTALLEGLRRGGVMASAKHFPGHGRTRADSHAELPVVEAGAGELRERDLVPFRRAAEAGVELVMSAHVAFPALEPDGARDVPATFSRAILTGLLRDELGFRGTVVSDALMMGALAKTDPGERAARALEAGVDCLLYPPDPRETAASLAQMLARGTIAEATIERASRNLARSLRLVETPAFESGIAGGGLPPGAGPIPAEGAAELARRAARAGLVGIGAWPRPGEGRSLVLLLLDGMIGRDRVVLAEAAASPDREFRWLVPDEASAELPADLGSFARVALAYFSPIRAWKGRAGFSAEAERLVRGLLKARPDATLISFGSPFILREVSHFPGALLAFGDVPSCQAAVGEVLAGNATPGGRLPIRL